MILTFIGLLVALILFLVKPHLLQKSNHINKPVSRAVILGIGVAALLVAFMGYGSVLAATEPASVKQERLNRQAVEQRAREAADTQQKRDEEAKKPVAKIELKVESVAFESTEQQDTTLPKGQTRVATEGVEGERTITSEVTYLQGKEVSRKEIKSEITRSPITKVTQIGTYETPVSAPAQSMTRTGAICNDGSPSSATGRGACSHHGGVARWLYG